MQLFIPLQRRDDSTEQGKGGEMLNGLYGYIFRQNSEEHPQHDESQQRTVLVDGATVADHSTTGNKPMTNDITSGADDEWILVDDCKSSGRSSPVLVPVLDIMESSDMKDFLDLDDAASVTSGQSSVQQNNRHQLRQTRMLAAQRRAVSDVIHGGAPFQQPSTPAAKTTSTSAEAVAREFTQGKMKRANQVVKAERKTKPRSMRVKQLVANRNNDRKCQY
uniref:Uncharacterized protein n=1 Tax=Plectus sambesii TaxID=2011161 RepID=A0A914WQ53_9BILA